MEQPNALRALLVTSPPWWHPKLALPAVLVCSWRMSLKAAARALCQKYSAASARAAHSRFSQVAPSGVVSALPADFPHQTLHCHPARLPVVWRAHLAHTRRAARHNALRAPLASGAVQKRCCAVLVSRDSSSPITAAPTADMASVRLQKYEKKSRGIRNFRCFGEGFWKGFGHLERPCKEPSFT